MSYQVQIHLFNDKYNKNRVFHLLPNQEMVNSKLKCVVENPHETAPGI